ncbi:hypothetical protein EI94DRAFT_1892498 [Lactarius quietus]|nr:hypothetical protein EI94DRAFT_1892498 [Lactarius quietus]
MQLTVGHPPGLCLHLHHLSAQEGEDEILLNLGLIGFGNSRASVLLGLSSGDKACFLATTMTYQLTHTIWLFCLSVWPPNCQWRQLRCIEVSAEVPTATVFAVVCWPHVQRDDEGDMLGKTVGTVMGICAGCNQHFTPAGYSRHISMTQRTICHAIYDRQVDRSILGDCPCVSGPPEDGNPNGSELDPQLNGHRDDDIYHMDVDANVRLSEEPSVPPPAEVPSHAQHDGAAFVEHFTMGAAGAPISNMGPEVPHFQSQCDWEFAQWAKKRGPSLTTVSELLLIDGVVENLGLSYHNTWELNHIIDEDMPARLKFKREEVQLGGELYDFHFCEIIPCLHALFGDARFSKGLFSAGNSVPRCNVGIYFPPWGN